jgi:ribosomal protein L22
MTEEKTKQDKKQSKETETKPEEKKPEEEKTEKPEEKREEKKPEEEKPEEKSKDKEETTKSEPKKKPAKKIAKEEVVVNAKNVPVSTKYAVSICKFIKGKEIKDARRYLEDVKSLKKSIPMKGEYAHKKDSGPIASGSGKYPVQASEQFIALLKTLAGNATNHDILNPIITEAIANKAPTPLGRFGRWKRKRTHITLKAREKKIKENRKNKNKTKSENKINENPKTEDKKIEEKK